MIKTLHHILTFSNTDIKKSIVSDISGISITSLSENPHKIQMGKKIISITGEFFKCFHFIYLSHITYKVCVYILFTLCHV